MELDGARVLVTGASSGIGAASAVAFAEAGATVGICARRADRLTEVLGQVREHAPGSRMWTVDLVDLDALDGFAARADDELGGIDILVNNAGIPMRRRMFDLPPEDLDAVMRVNFLAPVRLSSALLPAHARPRPGSHRQRVLDGHPAGRVGGRRLRRVEGRARALHRGSLGGPPRDRGECAALRPGLDRHRVRDTAARATASHPTQTRTRCRPSTSPTRSSRSSAPTTSRGTPPSALAAAAVRKRTDPNAFLTAVAPRLTRPEG